MAELLALAPLAAQVIPALLPLVMELFKGGKRPRRAVRGGRRPAMARKGRGYAVMNKWPLLSRPSAYKKGGRAPARRGGYARRPAMARKGRGYAVMNKWPLLSRPAAYRKGGRAPRRRGGDAAALKALMSTPGRSRDIASMLYDAGALFEDAHGDNLANNKENPMVAATYKRWMDRSMALSKALDLPDANTFDENPYFTTGDGRPRHRAGGRRSKRAPAKKGRGFLSDLLSGLPGGAKIFGRMLARKGMGAPRGGRMPARQRVAPHIRRTGRGPVMVKGHMKRRRGAGFLADLASAIPFVGPAISGLLEKKGMGRAPRRMPARRGGARGLPMRQTADQRKAMMMANDLIELQRGRKPLPYPAGYGRPKAHRVRPHVRVVGKGRAAKIVHVKGHTREGTARNSRRGGLLFPA